MPPARSPRQGLREAGARLLLALGWGAVRGLALGAVAFIGIPVVALIWRSLRDRAWELPLDSRIPDAILFSFQTTSLSLLLILLLGTPLAYALARWRFAGRRLTSLLIDLPIVLPPAVAGLGLLVAFGRRGLFGPLLDEGLGVRLAFTPAAVVLAQTFVAFPFYVRLAEVGFRDVDSEIESAALVDGASPWQCFLFVTFPMARRAMLSGALVSWSRALGEFGATIFFAGNLLGRSKTMPLLIYTIFESDVGAATWTALILMAAAALSLAVARLLAHGA